MGLNKLIKWTYFKYICLTWLVCPIFSILLNTELKEFIKNNRNAFFIEKYNASTNLIIMSDFLQIIVFFNFLVFSIELILVIINYSQLSEKIEKIDYAFFISFSGMIVYYTIFSNEFFKWIF